MKKRLFSFLLVGVILIGLVPSALAEVNDGYVTFTQNAKMEERNFDVDQIFDGLEPGDVRNYNVHLTNSYPSTTRWYMSNEVLKTLEENGINGGSYKYTLTYTNPSGATTILYPKTEEEQKHNLNIEDIENNEKPIGNNAGDDRIGLQQATEDLEKFFLLDTLNPNETGHVTLTVRFEGETQDNSYQNTMARIKMNFAAEIVPTGSNRTVRAVKTGDENNLVPYYIGMIVAGLLFLYLALDAFTDRLYKRGRVK